jgi:hypothetical protein
MAVAIILLFAVLIIFIILSQIIKPAQRNNKTTIRFKKLDYTQAQLPIGLNFRDDITLQALEERMEQGFTASFQEQLRQRVLAAYPHLNLAEFEWKLLELKRYLAMNVILRQVPMFSEAVDEIWHEMLMFTREYQQFCERLTGAMIHHTPHVQKQSMPDERAWFDWIYAHLFEFTPFSNTIWNNFYKYPINRERIQLLRELDEQEIYEKWFNVRAAELFPEIRSVIQILIQQAKSQIDAANDSENSFSRGSNLSSMDVMGYAASAMIFYSLMDNGNYGVNMQAMVQDNNDMMPNSSGSSCTACGTGDNGGSGGGSTGCNGGGSDGGGSSGCSSTSCGSGGGGGD